MRFSNILLAINSNACNDAAWERADVIAEQESDLHVVTDKSNAEILALVQERGHDLVIKSVTKSDSIGSRVSQRNDFDLMRTCPCPLWLVNSNDQLNDGIVLAALDMPPQNSPLTELNQDILDLARSIALAEFRQLHVVHAWQLAGEHLLRSRASAETNLQVDRILAEQEFHRGEWLRQTVSETESESSRLANRFLEPKLHLIKGSAKTAVPDLADKLETRLIVMGSAARKGVAGFIAGNTSENVITRSNSSLLIVKPGSVSPVRTNEVSHREAPDLKAVGGVHNAGRRSSIRRRDRLSRQYVGGGIRTHAS